MRLAPLVRVVLAALPALAARAEEPDTRALLAALALAPEEGEELLALALVELRAGDCEGALARLDALTGSAELARAAAVERARVAAWIALRDAFLAELEQSQKALALELGGKKLAAPIRREGDELVLARGPVERVSVRALAPEALVAAIPKERFAPADDWLKIYPYCVAGNPKWKRLGTSSAAAEELKRDALEAYPRWAALGPVAQALDALARSQPPADAPAARALLARIAELLALGREAACVRARREPLTQLATRLLSQAAAALEVADLVAAEVSATAGGAPRLTYDFDSPGERAEWRRDDGYLADLRLQLEPVRAADEDGTRRFAPGPQGFHGNGAACWRHALEFTAPLRVRYGLRWEPIAGQPGKVFAFALGMLADAEERHLRAQELGFLYVDERDGLYTAVRPKGDATVQLGQTYALELVHDGRECEVWVDGVLRARAAAPARAEGGVFLWLHSDLLVSVPRLEIEGRVTAASLARLRAEWAAAELAGLGLGPAR